MVSKAALQVSFFIVAMSWVIVLAPTLMEYYFTYPNASESLGDVFIMFCVITFLVSSVPFVCWILCEWIIED